MAESRQEYIKFPLRGGEAVPGALRRTGIFRVTRIVDQAVSHLAGFEASINNQLGEWIMRVIGDGRRYCVKAALCGDNLTVQREHGIEHEAYAEVALADPAEAEIGELVDDAGIEAAMKAGAASEPWSVWVITRDAGCRRFEHVVVSGMTSVWRRTK